MKQETKRYLVTYTDGSVSTKEAVDILGISKTKCKEGLAFMEADNVPAKDDVLHFENLGISTIELSADEAAKLSQKEEVLAVEEDFEMFALRTNESDEVQFDELFINSESEFPEPPVSDDGVYKTGYNQALLDLFASILNANAQNGTQGNEPLLSPIVPRFPLQPIYPIPFPKLPDLIIRRQPIPWNISLVKAPTAWARGIDGAGVKVAILDTGITSHPDLQVAGGASFIPGSSSYNDLHGHGTHCAGIVAARNNFIGVVGVAPKASLYAVKVLGDNGSGNSSWIIAGMEWCIANGIKVASMSLGGTNDPSLAYANAVKRCQDHGVTVVIASGNSYGSSFPWVCAPANSVIAGQANASPIAVGAVDSQSAIAGFSSRGGRNSVWNQVTCVAPGVSVNSTHLSSAYRAMSGTSMACPHVAGLAALIIQRYPGITPANVKRRITTTSTDLGARGNDITYGFGLINCDLATR